LENEGANAFDEKDSELIEILALHVSSALKKL
jgi:hypothetical protein